MLSCDYNGWTDAPEDEREALDAYEAAAEKAMSPSPRARVRPWRLNTATLVRGEADLVSFGPPFLANPEPVERSRASLPLNAPDRATPYGGDERGYTDYRTFDLPSRGDAAA